MTSSLYQEMKSQTAGPTYFMTNVSASLLTGQPVTRGNGIGRLHLWSVKNPLLPTSVLDMTLNHLMI